MVNHFTNKLTSPLYSIIGGYIYIAFLVSTLAINGFYKKSTFFTWGVPVDFMGTTIEDNMTYYSLLLLFFIHQLVNNWVNNVTYPWIVNCVQDPKSKGLVYSKETSLLIVNMFALYSELDVMLIIAGVMSQITFFVVLILANLIAVSFINLQYINDRIEVSFLIEEENSLV